MAGGGTTFPALRPLQEADQLCWREREKKPRRLSMPDATSEQHQFFPAVSISYFCSLLGKPILSEWLCRKGSQAPWVVGQKARL